MARSKQPTAYADRVSTSFLFRGLEQAEVVRLLSLDGIAVEHYAAGETIRSRESGKQSLSILCYGTASVEKRTGTGRILMSILGEGDILGAAAIFGEHAQYVAEITATKSVWLIDIPEAVLREMLKESFPLTENYLSYLTARIRFLSARLDGFAEGSVEERLLHHIRQHAVDGSYCCKVSLSKLADALAVSRATLYRALDALEASGEIVRESRVIRLCEKVR